MCPWRMAGAGGARLRVGSRTRPARTVHPADEALADAPANDRSLRRLKCIQRQDSVRTTYDVAMTAIARIPDIPPKGIKFTYMDGPFEEEGILVKLADGSVKGFKNECRHLPMKLDNREPSDLWDEHGRHIVCNAHGARYIPDSGLCVSGPCKGSHLKEVPLKITGDEVFVDTGATGSFFDV